MEISLKIVPDNDPFNPREDLNFGTIYYTSSRYNLGDSRISSEEIQALEQDPEMIHLPVYAYIHGGVCLNTTGFSCPWDSGQSGIIAVSKDQIRKEFGVKRITQKVLGQVKQRLASEVEIFSKYLNGEVYGFQVVDSQGEILDSCYGFYSEEDALEAGNEALTDHKAA